mmetsp:Transcript_11870/g.13067  ORF Transcript_11870/g.13067 Transcript_11870/m.13067 type:complete len:196 (+) Transcript_11870:3-590(+)
MLRHHRDGNFIEVGQKRRGQRLRPRQGAKKIAVPNNTTDGGTRSRSSSVSTESDVEDTKSTVYTADLIEEEADSDILPAGGGLMSNCTKVTLKKQVGKSWGVLLCKEGDMCVVVRASKTDSDGKISSNSRLSCGDMILSVTNNEGKSASTPSYSGHSRQTSTEGWFKEIVTLFKTSETLHLNVVRVGTSFESGKQ